MDGRVAARIEHLARVGVAGGFLIQALPPVDESAVALLEDRLRQLPSTTTLLREGRDGLAPLIEMDAVVEVPHGVVRLHLHEAPEMLVRLVAAVEQLDHIAGLCDTLQIFAQRQVSVHGFYLSNDPQITPARQHQLHPGERLEVTGLTRTQFAGTLDDGTQFSSLTGVQSQNTVSLAPISMTQDHRFNPD